MADAPLLELADIETSYGQSRVLFGISLAIAPGEMVSLMGRNGMGKTTTVRSIMGLTPRGGRHRSVSTARKSTALPAYRIAKLGLGLVPEGRQVFPESDRARKSARHRGQSQRRVRSVDARKSIRAVSAARRTRRRDGQPALRRRAADAGDRPRADDQSAADHSRRSDRRACAADPRRDLALPRTAPQSRGQSILVIDKNVDALTRIADRHYIIERGRVVWSGTSQALGGPPDVQHRYLGI